MIVLVGAQMLMSRHVLLRPVLQGQGDKAGTHTRCIMLYLRLDGLVTHWLARRVIAAPKADKQRVAGRHHAPLLQIPDGSLPLAHPVGRPIPID